MLQSGLQKELESWHKDSSGPVVWTPHFHCEGWGMGLIPGQGTINKILHAAQ